MESECKRRAGRWVLGSKWYDHKVGETESRCLVSKKSRSSQRNLKSINAGVNACVA